MSLIAVKEYTRPSRSRSNLFDRTRLTAVYLLALLVPALSGASPLRSALLPLPGPVVSFSEIAALVVGVLAVWLDLFESSRRVGIRLLLFFTCTVALALKTTNWQEYKFLIFSAIGVILASSRPEVSAIAAKIAIRTYALIVFVSIPIGTTHGLYYAGSRAPVLPLLPKTSERLSGYLSHPNIAAQVFLAGIISEFGFSSLEIKKKTRLGFLILETYLLLRTESQTALLAALSAIFFALIKIRTARRWGLRFTWALMFVPVVIFSIASVGLFTTNVFSAKFATGRGLVWNELAVLMHGHQLFGLPVGDVVPTSTPNNLLTQLTGSGHAHNLPLEIWALGGIPILAIFGIIFWRLAMRATSSRNSSAAAGALMLCCATELPLLQLQGSWNVAVTLALIGVALSEKERICVESLY